MLKADLSLRGLLEVSSIGLLFVSVVSIFDNAHRYLELLTHFKLQYLCFALLFLFISVLIRNIQIASYSLTSFLINSYFVLPLFFGSASEPQVDKTSEIKVLLSNVLTGNTRYTKLENLIRSEEPDILVLQEIDSNWVKNMSPVFDEYPHRLIQPRSDNFGIAVLSKIKVLEQNVVSWGRLGIPSIESKLKFGDQIFHLLATHPLPPTSPENYQFRNTQISDVAARVIEIEAAKLVVGDLNITPWSSDYKPLEAELTNARYGFGVLPTWSANIPILRIPIDHILVSEDFEVLNTKTGPDIGSDHLPLISVLRLKQ